MSEEKNIPEEGQKDEGLSPKNKLPELTAHEKLETEVQNQEPVDMSLESTDNFKPPTQSNEEASQPQPATPSTLNPQPSTSHMEVHHHGHVHEKKKWKEYLFQFFMLFLAVFCGFLAEYQLEHVIENSREKQFMKSMVNDLQKDALLLEDESKRVMVQSAKLDSLTQIIYKGELDRVHVRKMYELQRRYLYPIALTLISRTELQLKNSGGMRLIRNRQVTDSIINYWSTTELLYETKDAINSHRGKAKDLSFSLFSNKYYKHTEDFSLDFPLDSEMGEPELMTKNPIILSEFANRISHMNDLLKFNYKQRHVDRQVGNSIRLIRLIKKEYHL